jgi:hypothetical protein
MRARRRRRSPRRQRAADLTRTLSRRGRRGLTWSLAAAGHFAVVVDAPPRPSEQPIRCKLRGRRNIVPLGCWRRGQKDLARDELAQSVSMLNHE